MCLFCSVVCQTRDAPASRVISLHWRTRFVTTELLPSIISLAHMLGMVQRGLAAQADSPIVRKVRIVTGIKTAKPLPPAWQAYRDLFAEVQNTNGWTRQRLVDELNADVKAKALSKCSYSKRATEYWETNPATSKRSDEPRDYRVEHLHQWLSEHVTDTAFSARLAAIAPPMPAPVPSDEAVGDKPLPTPSPEPEGEVQRLDRKNVVVMSGIRDALLAGKPPALRKCVMATQTIWLHNDEKPGKHLFGISTVLFVRSPATKQPVLLWYQRAGKTRIPENLEGRSILFHSSFKYDVDGEEYASPMDKWVALGAEEPERAEETSEISNLLRKLIRYKIQIPPKFPIITCVPLGAISRNRDRPGQKPRWAVYTHYVFRTTIDVLEAKTTDVLKRIVKLQFKTPKQSPVAVRLDALPPKHFLEQDTPMTIDHLAFSALHCKTPELKCEDTIFSRGFAIL